jgi:predicted nucleic acid-binding protein
VVSWRAPETARDLLDLIADVVQDRLVRVDAELAGAAAALAATSGLTVYDAAYVVCARRGGWTLVSCDLRDLVRPGLAVAPDQALGNAEP